MSDVDPQEVTEVLIEHVLHNKGRQVWTIPPGATVAEAVAELRQRGVGALVVAEEPTTVTGIFSERDVVRALAEEGAEALERSVADLMSTDVATCRARASVEELMRLMTERRIRHVPVVEDGRLAGLVSIGDVVKSRIDELRVEAEALQHYLASGAGAPS